MKKVSSKKRYAKTVIYFRVDTRLMDLVSTLKRFYRYTTKNELLPYLLIMSVLELASLKADPAWTKDQKKAHKEAKKFSSDFGQAIALQTAKQVLKEQKPDTLMTVPQLSNKVKKKLKSLQKET